jgi:hypothetical protein
MFVRNVLMSTRYLAFDTRLDGKLGAKRVEWSFKDAGVAWAPIQNVNDPSLTCKLPDHAVPPLV